MTKSKYILYEFIRMVLLLVAVVFASYFLISKAPVDPVMAFIGPENTLSEEVIAEVTSYWGLDKPLIVRFTTWVSNALHGDMGISTTFKLPVAQVLKVRFLYSIVLMLLAWTLSGIFGFLLGVLCGWFEGSVFDRVLKLFSLTLKSAPTFWLGLIILSLFAVRLGWFPIGMAAPIGKAAADVTLAERIHHLILPLFTLTLVSMSDIILYTRQKLVEIKNSDFILYARARGENGGTLVRRHVLRNIALPAITLQFASFSELFGGMALAENVFSYPGLGTATTAAAMNVDIPLLLGATLISALFVFTGNLIANILYGVFDPRIGTDNTGGIN